jgi:SAM-dependent methyltransferase
MNILPDHLGGHANKTHLDRGALQWLIKTFRINSFLDIGCGPGGMVELASLRGLYSVGIDGDFTIERNEDCNFIIHDFAESAYTSSEIYDIGWSCEFVEHVYEEYIPNYMPCFKQCKNMIITYAPPGWPGHHHVNLKEEEYWINIFEKNDFEYNEELTLELRKNSTMNLHKQKKAFVKNRGLFFNNKKL